MFQTKSRFLCFVILQLFSWSHSAPIDEKTQPQVIHYEFEKELDEGYHLTYKLTDGTYKDEYGSLQKVGDKNILSITGTYSFVENGTTYALTYTSDENGFRASGNHLPKAGTDVAQTISISLSPSLMATLTAA